MDDVAKRFLCVDCRRDTIEEYYMVRPDVWSAAGMAYHDGMLCIGCLETRIGRRLRAADFSPFPINHSPAVRTPRLTNRLARRGRR